MLKKEIKFKDRDGTETTEVCYFHLDESEIIELDADHQGGLEETIRRIQATQNQKDLIKEFKRIILLSYGVKEGKKFLKSEELNRDFIATGAYNALFMELATNDKSAAEFMNGIIPSDLAAKLAQINNETVMPPPSLVTPSS